MLTWVCILKSANDSHKLLRIAFTFAVIFSDIITTAGLLAFIHKNASVDFEKTVFACCISFITIGLIHMVCVASFLRRGIFSIFEKSSEIYNASKLKAMYKRKYIWRLNSISDRAHDSFQFLVQVNTKRERMWNIFFKAIRYCFLCVICCLKFKLQFSFVYPHTESLEENRYIYHTHLCE